MNFLIPDKKPELLPCPFCGGEAEVIINKSKEGQTSDVHCSLCSCRKVLLKHPSYEGNIEQDAIDNWNTRTPIENDEAIIIETIRRWKEKSDMYDDLCQ